MMVGRIDFTFEDERQQPAAETPARPAPPNRPLPQPPQAVERRLRLPVNPLVVFRRQAPPPEV